jgi:ubiquitin-protein ligase
LDRGRNYPSAPPELEVSVVVPHPNVFAREFVCLDMLRASSDGGGGARYSGWSSAYTLQVPIVRTCRARLHANSVCARLFCYILI